MKAFVIKSKLVGSFLAESQCYEVLGSAGCNFTPETGWENTWIRPPRLAGFKTIVSSLRTRWPPVGRFERSRLLSLALHRRSHLPRLVFLQFEVGLALAVESSYLPRGGRKYWHPP